MKNLISKLKEGLNVYIRVIQFLKSLSYSTKIVIIIVVNIIFIYISLRLIFQFYLSLLFIDILFTVLFLRPIFFIFSSYFLTSFFYTCILEISQDKILIYLGLFLACIILLLIMFFHPSLKVKLWSSLTSFIIENITEEPSKDMKTFIDKILIESHNKIKKNK